MVTFFKYLGVFLLAEDNDCPYVVSNLRKAQREWLRLARVLVREGADARTSVQIYLALVKLVMLYGSETWVMTPFRPLMKIGRGLNHFLDLS